MPIIEGMSDELKTCPECAETVEAAANRCRFFGTRASTARQVKSCAQHHKTSSFVRVLFMLLVMIFVVVLLGVSG